jgi:dCMP deaminase
MEKISKIEFYLNIAHEIAKKSTCLRTHYGAVIVREDQIISTGYNGSPRGCFDCIDVGICYRKENNIPSGTQYERCRSVHAEMNAIIHAGRERTIGSTIYLVGIDVETGNIHLGMPCLLCTKILINSNIKEIFIMNSKKQEVFHMDFIGLKEYFEVNFYKKGAM